MKEFSKRLGDKLSKLRILSAATGIVKSRKFTETLRHRLTGAFEFFRMGKRINAR